MQNKDKGTAEHQFYHTFVAMQFRFDPFDVHPEGQPTQSKQTVNDTTGQGTDRVRVELKGRKEQKVKESHGEVGAQSEDSHSQENAA